MRTALILLALLTILPASEGSARRAPMRGSEAYLLNDGAALPTTGALIVGLRRAQGRNGAGRRDLTSFPALSLRRGGTRIPLRLEQLSATLARYVPRRRPSPGRYRVTGLGESVRFVGRPAARRLAAPAVRAVQRRANTPRSGTLGDRRRRPPQLRQTTYSVRVVFDRALPASAVGIVLEDSRGGFAGGPTAGVSDSWEHTSGGRGPMPSGTRSPPVVGAEVTVRLVDRNGRLGAPVTIPMSEG